MTTVVCESASSPWPGSVPDFVPPGPGEHPRLFFRKADVPSLRKRAETPEGAAILKQLRTLLGNDGEAVPDVYNTNVTVNTCAVGTGSLPVGAYTLWHGAGFGLLYQLTGERKYADFARHCVEKAIAGTPDRDERYCWTLPGGPLRCGPVLSAIALAYDLCYDGWDTAFRECVCSAIVNYESISTKWNAPGKERGKPPKPITMLRLSYASGYPVTSNHIGGYLGGTGLALLAVRGDPGGDDKLVDFYLANIEERLRETLDRGHGDHGWYAEGTHPGRTSANSGLIEFLMALKSAAGRDYFTGRSNGHWMTLRWVMELVSRDGVPSIPHRGVYGSDDLYEEHPGLSHGGEFATGFGAVPAALKPAVLWSYNTFVREWEGNGTYNARRYPHRAVHAFLHWPIGVKPVNPAGLLPRAIVDKPHEYYLFRNRWKNEDDIIVTALLGSGPLGYYKMRGGPLLVVGHGKIRNFPEGGDAFSEHRPYYYRSFQDGSALLSAVSAKNGPLAMGVDYSGASGAELLLVCAGGGVRLERQAAVNGVWVQVMTLPEGRAEAVKVRDGVLVMGDQEVSFNGRNFAFKVAATELEEIDSSVSSGADWEGALEYITAYNNLDGWLATGLETLAEDTGEGRKILEALATQYPLSEQGMEACTHLVEK